jgi:hypothetical protein
MSRTCTISIGIENRADAHDRWGSGMPSPRRHGRSFSESRQNLAEPRGMRPLVAHCHLGLGKL